MKHSPSPTPGNNPNSSFSHDELTKLKSQLMQMKTLMQHQEDENMNNMEKLNNYEKEFTKMQ